MAKLNRNTHRRIAQAAKKIANKASSAGSSQFFLGVYVGASTDDPLLAIVQCEGSEWGSCQTLAGSSFTAGDQVLMVKNPGLPMIVLGVPQGNVYPDVYPTIP